MKKVASIFLVVCIVFITKQSISLEKGKWSFVKDNDPMPGANFGIDVSLGYTF